MMKKIAKMALIALAIVSASSKTNLFAQQPSQPVASFTSSKLTVCVNGSVDFNNTSYAVAPATSIVKFKWVFGPGAAPSVDTSNWSPTNVVFFNAGNNNYVTLSVTDNLGQTTSTGATIIVPFWANPQVYPQNTKTLCPGDSVLLYVQPTVGVSYQWTIDNVNIVGAVDSTLMAKAAGLYNCLVTDANGCIWSANKYVQYYQPFNPSVTTWEPKNGNKTLKSGDTLGLCSNATGVNVNAQVDWWAYNGTSFTWSNGQSGQNAVLSNPGVYYFTVSANGCSESSDSFNVSLLPAPSPILVGPVDSVFCYGDTTVILGVQSGFATYDWQNNKWGIGQNAEKFTVQYPGTFSCIVTDANGCTASTAERTFYFNNVPNQPEITPIYYPAGCNIASSNSPGCAYQWLLYDTALSGETSQYLNVSAYGSGFYKVKVTNAAGCSAISDPVLANCTVTGELEFGDQTYSKISLYPNPASGIVNVELPWSAEGEIAIFSTLGNVVSVRKIAGKGMVEMNLSGIAPGVYFIKTVSQNGTLYPPERLIIQ